MYVPRCTNGITELRWVLFAKSISGEERTHDFRTQEQAQAWAEKHYDDWTWAVTIAPVIVPDLSMAHFR
jgi:hypothetical protein